jgi:hypothetical protein
MLQEIDAMLQGVEVKTGKILGEAPEVARASVSLREAYISSMQLGWAIMRMSGDKNIDRMIAKLMNTIRIIWYVNRLLSILETVMMAPTPMGLYVFAARMFATTVTAADMAAGWGG